MQVNAQHGLQCKRGSAVFTFGIVRGDQFDQRCPRHNAIHFKQKLALAGLFNAEVQIEIDLFHGLYVPRLGLRLAHKWPRVMQSFPKLTSDTDWPLTISFFGGQIACETRVIKKYARS